MGAKKKQKNNTLKLIIALIVVVVGGVLFIGAVSGWFNSPKAKLDAEYICQDECDREFIALDSTSYEKLISSQKSFILFVDQGGCTTADRLRGYVQDWASEHGVRIHRIMFSELKKSSLHDQVKFYPSVVVISKGKPIVYLRADSDEDADEYNDATAFNTWLEQYLAK